ncbi:MAG TPA: TIGR01777 family oxidoreductase [Nocardioides sp.]|uniref:TIGR01777 family oxidoreductase n=1 Tax=Nocardioides sp. TaxID=35761 RepID=UPI002ED851B6
MARVVIAGASGFLGSHLSEELRGRGHDVVALVRRHPAGPHESRWDPYAGVLDRDLVAGASVVVNLAGSPTLGNPHSRRWSTRLRESRVTTTRVLAEAVAAASRPPAFLAGNAVGWYGDHGAEPVDETSDSRTGTLMTNVCRDWQDATAPAVAAGGRVCFLRTAPVMDAASAPLKQLRLLFRAGLGARLGDGAQRMPLVSLRDWVGAVAHLVESDVAGPVNVCCPATPTNAEFTRALAAAVRRPAALAVPAPVLRVAAGRLSPELLGSVDVRPEVLRRSGYVFRDADVAAVIRTGLA